MISKAVSEYVRLRGEEGAKIDPRLEAIVNRLFEKCFGTGEFKQAAGIALEARRLDVLEQAVTRSGDAKAMLSYCVEAAKKTISSRDFRRDAFRKIIALYERAHVPDHENIAEALAYLGDSAAMGALLKQLVSGTEADALLGYQIAFNLVDTETRTFLQGVAAALPEPAAAAGGGEAMVVNNDNGPADLGARFARLRVILGGEMTISYYLEFLYQHNRADLLLLKNLKTKVESRNSVLHGATVAANALMHCGTTVDTFLRENLEWLARATHWAKFSATASLGVIHKGHLKESLRLLAPYLPAGGGAAGGSPYSEGGSLMALGLIHANHGGEMTDYLLNALRNATGSEIVQHGACLGLAVTAMSSLNAEVYAELQTVLSSDSAVAGEAAGLAMGLTMMGSNDAAAIEEMLAYARETSHEKIVRGLGLGIAFAVYGHEEGADATIAQLIGDKDPVIRYGGMYALGMAYCGTSNNSAIRRLLHVAVSDVNDDVRHAAVTNLGFVLFREPEACPRMVALLSESYNAHVRYGATLAVGISNAGTGNREAVELLRKLATDSVDFVRQGASIALSMVLIQASEARDPVVAEVRKQFDKVLGDKHEPVMAKFGAVLASGIIDAGGRNVTLSLLQNKKQTSVVGLALFAQYWFWYPMTMFLSLSFTPTALIALNKDLALPKFAFESKARPALFAYPEPLKAAVNVAPTKVAAAVLSTAHKTKARKDRKDADKAGGMDIDSAPNSPAVGKPADTAAAAAAAAAAGAATTAANTATAAEGDKAGKRKKEPTSETLENPSRVVPAQQDKIVFDRNARYTPVSSRATSGIVILLDRTPDAPVELVDIKAPQVAGGQAPAEDAGPEPNPPEPFDWVE